MPKQSVAAIVVTYNRKDLLAECLEALQKSEYDRSKYELFIYVVNNASTDGTGEFLDEYARSHADSYETRNENDSSPSEVGSAPAFVYHLSENSGGAGGFAKGMNEACKDGRDYIWLMDDDTMVKPDTLAKLLEAKDILKDEFGFLSSLAYWTDGSLCKMNYHNISKDWYTDKILIRDNILKIEMATFVSFFVKRETVVKLGLPYKEYFIWGDDTEYSLRISRDYKCYLCGQSSVVHKMKANKSSERYALEDDEERVKRLFYSFRNDINTYKKQRIKRRIGLFIWYWKEFFSVMLGRHVPYRGLKLRVLCKAGWAGLWFHPVLKYPEGQ